MFSSLGPSLHTQRVSRFYLRELVHLSVYPPSRPNPKLTLTLTPSDQKGFIKASAGDASSNNATEGVSRCRSCGAGNSGACNFVLGEGPYCWKEPGSREVKPCSVCCTEPEVPIYTCLV